MIPILYEATETRFVTNGLGRLSDAISCTATEERNGQFELEMQYPITGNHYDEIQEERIILATPCDGATDQPFIIYSVERSLNGVAVIRACHISYRLKNMVVMPFVAESAAGAMAQIQSHIVGEHPFTFWTDKQVNANMAQTVPIECRSLLGGVQGSVLDVYGAGEYEFDRFDVKLHLHRGADNGVTIRYGKNLTGLDAEIDTGDVYTSIVPYWTNGEQTVVGGKVESEHVGDYSCQKCIAMDFSVEWEEAPTVAQLEARARKYLEDNAPWEPSSSIDVSFQPLWQTEEYKDIAPLERVRLCDTVTVEYERLGVSAREMVICTVYNVLMERYDRIELGSARTSLAEAVTRDTASREDLERSVSEQERAVREATDLITGGRGGYVRLMHNADKQPEEILVMDLPNVDTAQHVWRWNREGLGYSKQGYGGPYGTAITSDGKIVADFIQTGILNANIIRAGILQSVDGESFSLNLDTGAMQAEKLSWSALYSSMSKDGKLVCSGAEISGDIYSSNNENWMRITNGELYGGENDTQYTRIGLSAEGYKHKGLAMNARSIGFHEISELYVMPYQDQYYYMGYTGELPYISNISSSGGSIKWTTSYLCFQNGILWG